jgi:hypothetical protein
VSALAPSPADAAHAGTGATAPAAPRPLEACPLCGAPLQPAQEWCLQCGAAARTRLAAAPNWRLPTALIAVLAALSLGVIAAALVKLAGETGPGPAPTTTTITTPAPAAPAPSATTAAPAPTSPAAGAAPTTAAPGGTTVPPSGASASPTALPQSGGTVAPTPSTPAAPSPSARSVK